MSLITARNADEWLDIASSSYVPLAFQRVAPDFRAELDWRQLSEGVSLSGVHTQAIVVERTERLARAATTDDIHISLQSAGRGSIVQSGRVSQVQPGVLTVTETNRPFTLNYIEPNERHIILQVSRSALGVSDDILNHASGRQLAGLNPARDAYISLVTSFMSSGTPMSVTGTEEMSVLVTSLATAMLRSAWESTPTLPTSTEAMYHAMVTFVRSHLTSPSLSPDTLAQAHFVSRRRLYEIFESKGESPADVIRRERIDRASRVLNDEGHAQMSIADIAFELGFSDVTTFTRAFRRYNGCTPSDWRRRLSA